MLLYKILSRRIIWKDLLNSQIMKQAAGRTEEAHELDWLCTVQNLRMDGKILVQIVRFTWWL